MRLIREIDLMLLAATLMTILLGITMVYSAAYNSDALFERNAWQKQSTYAALALVLMAIITYLPNKIFYSLAYPLYAISLFSLILVLFWGTGDETARWLYLGGVGFQPSEFAKITTLIALSRYLSDTAVGQVNHLRTFLIALSIIVAPMFLVARQPDLGTAVSFAAPLFPMLYWGGMTPLLVFIILSPVLSVVFSFEDLWKDLITQVEYIFAAFITVSTIAVQVRLSRLWVTLTLLFVNLSAGLITSYLWNHFLRDYQKARILTFLDPETDRLNHGWNIIQSKIAIGSGGGSGKGFLEGTQTKYEFLPAAHTDFIFSVIGEELGFVGAVVVLSLFLFLIWRALHIGSMAKNRFYSLLAIGLGSLLTFHVFVNIGMTIGVMPVTGLPLPFLSYGGSSLLTNSIGVGLLLHAYIHRHEY